MLYCSPEFGKLIGASFATRARGVVRPVGLYVLHLRKRWQSSPDPKSGGYARASTLGHPPAPFPPDAGAQSTGTRGEDRADLASGRLVDRRFSRARKSTIADTQIWGPSRAKSLARQRRDNIHMASICRCNHRVHWRQEPLWLNRAPMERVAQAKAQPSGDERRVLQSQDQAHRHGT